MPRCPTRLLLPVVLSALASVLAGRSALAGDVAFFVPGCPVRLTAVLPSPFVPVREAPDLVEQFNANPGRRARFSLAVEAPSLRLSNGRAASLLLGTPGAVMAAQGRVSAETFADIRDGFDADMRAAMDSDAARTVRDALERGIEERDGIEMTLLGTTYLDTVAPSDHAVAAVTYSSLALDGQRMEGYAVQRLDYVAGCIVGSNWTLPPTLVPSAVRKLAAALLIAPAD